MSSVPRMDPCAEADRIATIALAEDGGLDITTEVTGAGALPVKGAIELRNPGVFAGAAFADAVARQCGCSIGWDVAAGYAAPTATALGVIQGPLAAVLRAERPLLNLLQRACGVATTTRAFVDAVAGSSCRILHTRKTAPGLRALDIDAVLAGGGGRHRADLMHEVMIKDNHWYALRRAGRSLADALAAARARGAVGLHVEVESLEQLEEACAAGATRLLIDNQSPDTVRAWTAIAQDRSSAIAIEATGGITLQNVRAYADAGIDFASIGALTHSVRAADVALELEFPDRVVVGFP